MGACCCETDNHATRGAVKVGNAALYAGIGRTLLHYDLDVENCAVTERGELLLPNNIQYGWPHSQLPVLYVSCGVGAQINAAGDWACALTLAPSTGEPLLLGSAARISSRALHLSLDQSGQHLLLAHPRPAGISVLRISADGAIVGQVDQRPGIAPGSFPHQVRVTPDGLHCICVSRGIPSPHEWMASTQPQTEPGSLQIYNYQDGRLGDSETIALGDGYHFGPRNLDFHGSRVYLGLETQNELVVFQTDIDGKVSPTPIQRISTLANPAAELHQGAGPVLIHPQLEVLYVANRAYQPGPNAKRIISAKAENSIVVYALDADSGLLTEIQRIDSGGACPRTLALDPTGQMLIVANSETYEVLSDDTDNTEKVQMNLSTFRVLADGRLEFGRRSIVDSRGATEIAWAGVASF